MAVRKREYSSTPVRVNKSVEELVRIVSRRYNVDTHHIRNIAILIGLIELNRYLYINGARDIEKLFTEVLDRARNNILVKP